MLTATGQFLDSVNVPPPGLLLDCGRRSACVITRCITLPPGAPLSCAGEAHRRLKEALPADSAISWREIHDSLPKLVMNLVAGSAKGAAA